MILILGKALIFGTDTGVNLDGDVMLNCGEVRHNWLDVSIHKKKRYNFAKADLANSYFHLV